MNEEKGQLAKALAAAQKAFPKIILDRKVTVRSDKGNYDFNYATLGNLLFSTREPLVENGLAVTQYFDVCTGGMSPSGAILVTELMHVSGESRIGKMPVRSFGSTAKMQEIGSEITYLRRYAFAAIIGIVGEDDDDANGADGNSIHDRIVSPPILAPVSPPEQQTAAQRPTAAKPLAKAAARPTKRPPDATPPPVVPPVQQAPTGQPATLVKAVEAEASHCFGEPQKGDPVITIKHKENILKVFAAFQITQLDLEKKAGYPMEQWTGSDDPTVGMKGNLQTDYMTLHLGRCTKEQWLASTCPAVDYPPKGP